MNNLNNLKVLVTGAGGDIAQTVIKCLHDEGIKRVVGADCNVNTVGSFLCDDFVVLPYADSNIYEEQLTKTLSDKKIDVLIPVTEPEIAVIAVMGLERKTDVKVLLPNPVILEHFLDKYDSFNFCNKSGIKVPFTSLLGADIKWKDIACTPPFIIKPRKSSGSKETFIIKDQNDFEYHKIRGTRESIIQEYIFPDDQEYTCGVFGSRKGQQKVVCFKRTLEDGFSIYAEVIRSPDIEAFCLDIADKLNLVGSINIQVRLTEKGPVLIEINPRFSSTVYFRHHVGFKDVIWSILDHFSDLELPDFILPEGARMFRLYTELFIDGRS